MSQPSFKKTIKRRKIRKDYEKKRNIAHSVAYVSHVEVPKLQAGGMNKDGFPLVRQIGVKTITVHRKRDIINKQLTINHKPMEEETQVDASTEETATPEAAAERVQVAAE